MADSPCYLCLFDLDLSLQLRVFQNQQDPIVDLNHFSLVLQTILFTICVAVTGLSNGRGGGTRTRDLRFPKPAC